MTGAHPACGEPAVSPQVSPPSAPKAPGQAGHNFIGRVGQPHPSPRDPSCGRQEAACHTLCCRAAGGWWGSHGRPCGDSGPWEPAARKTEETIQQGVSTCCVDT